MGKGTALDGRIRCATRQRGFSIPELVVVLALVGLLVGGVVLGGGLVTEGRIRSLSNDFFAVTLAVAAYADRYGALPGDDPQAEARWPGRARNGTGDRQISGTYESPPPANDPLTSLTIDATTGESLNFWWHL